MSTGKQLAGLLMLSTALTFPGIALAQSADEPADAPVEASEEPAPAEDIEDYEEPDISVPGGAIVVTGRRIRDVERISTQVVSVLSSEQIARTGEGDIAGALGRVTGLSVQGQGYVFVRGLGDRYSLALLNGLPLPSPQPLSRVVPLDIFPTNIVASSLVQKTYSANYPGEFGGGVINLTTKAIPDESFLDVSAGISGDTETTGQVGYDHYGSDYDWFGFDDGARNLTPALKSFFNSGERLNDIPQDPANAGSDGLSRAAILKSLVNPNLHALQKIENLRPNFSGSITAGTAFDVGSDGRLGVIATASISNKYRNRVISKQFVTDPTDLANGVLQSDSTAYTTDNRILVNGLLGFGLEIGEHKFRWTNLYVRDTLKQSALALGTDFETGFAIADQDTAWYERQLIDTQLVGEMKFGDLSVDTRAGFAQTQREAPFETTFRYFSPNDPDDPYENWYRNDLDQNGLAQFNFSKLKEDLYFGGIDLSYPLMDGVTATVGYSYSDTSRRSEFRSFRVQGSRVPTAIQTFNPLNLLGSAIIDLQFVDPDISGVNYDIDLLDINAELPIIQADLEVHGAYAQARIEPLDGLTVDLGARYEDAVQSTGSVEVYNTPLQFPVTTTLKNDYILPAATITYDFDNGLQVRASASKTIARPQFRELVYQPFLDPDTGRLFIGNPELRDSELINAEARAEYYFGRGNRVSVAGFYKDIDSPIEAFTNVADSRVRISYANAPKAELYGAELELQYNYDLFDLGKFFETRRAVFVANYTYTQSKLKVGDTDVTWIYRGPGGGDPTRLASNIFDDGVPMTGQSDHLVNLQIGMENTDKISQQTLLLSYASKRVVSRGFNGLPPIVESPGLRLDFVMREEVKLAGMPLELKFEARNLTGRGHEEYQSDGTSRIEVNSYDIGTSFSFSVKAKF